VKRAKEGKREREKEREKHTEWLQREKKRGKGVEVTEIKRGRAGRKRETKKNGEHEEPASRRIEEITKGSQKEPRIFLPFFLSILSRKEGRRIRRPRVTRRGGSGTCWNHAGDPSR